MFFNNSIKHLNAHTMKFLKTGRHGDQTYVQQNGSAVVIFMGEVSAHFQTLGGILFSEDGQIFHELFNCMACGPYQKETIYAYEPSSGRLLRMALQTEFFESVGMMHAGAINSIIVDGTSFLLTQTPPAVELIQLPACFELPLLSPHAYAFKHDDGRTFVFPNPESFALDAFVSVEGDSFFSTLQIYDYRSDDFTRGYLANEELGYQQQFMVNKDAMVLGGENIGYEMSAENAREHPHLRMGSRYFGLHKEYGDFANGEIVDSLNGLSLHTIGFKLILGGEKLTKIECPGSVLLTRFEDVFRPENLFETADGNLLYVSTSKYRLTEHSLRVFLIVDKATQELPVRAYSGWRGSGNFEIITDSGRLFYTFSNKATEEQSNFDGCPIKELDLNQYRIEENHSVCQLTRKQ
ncbi:MAG: hypothetical protein IAF58_19315 [Leptolyngbya sp.]|nr:hypothetical protein [Candidatus Melainabacteria bacterium]